MNKKQIVDYVMNTPNNTNKMILGQMLDTYSEQSGVQADWNQNDETAKDYVKNRTHYIKYEEYTVHTVSLNFSNFEKIDNKYRMIDSYIILDEMDRELTSSLVFNTQRFNFEANERICGNLYLFDNNLEDNGLPFYYNFQNYEEEILILTEDFLLANLDEEDNITIYQKMVREEIVKIPEKYLPDLSKDDLVLEWSGKNDSANVGNIFSLDNFSVISGEADKVMTKLGEYENTRIIMLGQRKYDSEYIYTSYLPVQSVCQLNGKLGLTFLLPKNEYTLDTYYMVNIKINDSNEVTEVTYKTLQYA